MAQLGWDTEAHVELLWSLSRAPDADAALHALIRLAETPEAGWNELDAALRSDRSLRPGCLRCLVRRWHLGIIWSRTRVRGGCWAAT
ncbi:putative bifunctional glutamine-synthetase adenylyltransferase/deadenyltransferase [Mycobacterium xenopi 4042]|uniref:Putative bifunctional glutamine-synthetase adenylyltransferase/deadenyltransferase n=1 Tax=Mycobacterium xenopi 4042 TaxID=1299334 RepID=X8DAY4_MYCXE|nr:putative bifunctional glutamine-synthetase adenylyltransferase/deadenyltransferase [Mycobacterium xenopi 4042]